MTKIFKPWINPASEKKRRSRHFHQLLFLIPAGLLLAYYLTSAILTNLHSLDCYHAVFSDQAPLLLLSDRHSCTVVGDVADAIYSGDRIEAANLLRPLARNGSLPALRLILDLDGRLSEDSEAVAFWEKSRSFSELLRFAEMATRARNLTVAEEAYRLAWLLEPASTTPSLAGFLIEATGDGQAAADVWQETLSAYPEAFTEAERQLVRARILSGHSDLSKAAKEYRLFINENPNSEMVRSAYYELAWVHRRMGEMPEAVSAIEQTLRIDLPWPATWQIQQRAGAIYEAAGFPDKAIAAYRSALSMNEQAPGAAEALIRLTGQ